DRVEVGQPRRPARQLEILKAVREEDQLTHRRAGRRGTAAGLQHQPGKAEGSVGTPLDGCDLEGGRRVLRRRVRREQQGETEHVETWAHVTSDTTPRQWFHVRGGRL